MKKLTAAAIALLLGAGSGLAVPTNITIDDPNDETDTIGWHRGDNNSLTESEYQEVEPDMQTGAKWDLVAFSDLGNGSLGLLSGYNLKDGTTVANDGLKTSIGDIFISTNPTSWDTYPDGYDYPQFVKNGDAPNSWFNFDFALKLDFAAGKYHVYDLDADTVLENALYYNNSNDYNAASNPWRIAQTVALPGGNLGQFLGSYDLLYDSTVYNAYADSVAGFDVSASYKHFVELKDLDVWLNPELDLNNPQALFHLTMECGNDNLYGSIEGGFKRVPDGATTLALLGMGLIGLAGVRRFGRR